MLAAQRAVGGIVHDEEGHAVFDIEVQHAHDMRVDERCDGLGLAMKVLDVGSVCQVGVQDFDGGLHVKPQVLTEIDLGEASASEQAHEAIVAQLLTYTIRHSLSTCIFSTEDKIAEMLDNRSGVSLVAVLQTRLRLMES